jgi:ferredoxin--NADP+ reductase
MAAPMADFGGQPLRVAIVGSGPAGFYAAQALLRSGRAIAVDVLDRLPVPYGLVRHGVAPDHQKLKSVTALFEKIGQSDALSFRGNVTVGRDVSVDELRETHHVVILAYGAATGRATGIDGEDLPGSLSATEFVGWYNGHPDYRDLEVDLDTDTAVVLGQGNVAVDVARILAKPAPRLASSDIAAHALDALGKSSIRDIHVVGRRGPVQSKISPKELREVGALEDCDVAVQADDLVLNAASRAELDDPHAEEDQRRMQLFESFTTSPSRRAARRIEFHFLSSPVAIDGDTRVRGITFECNRLRGRPFAQRAEGAGERYRIEAGLVIRSIGYSGLPIDDRVPFDADRGIVPNDDGRVISGGMPVPGLYCTGWIARGPRGLIGDNREHGVRTAKNVLEDFPQETPYEARPGIDALDRLLEMRGVRSVCMDGWRRIDASECDRGERLGKPREKYTCIEEMLELADAPRRDAGSGYRSETVRS